MKKDFPFLLIFLIIIGGTVYFLYYHRIKIKNSIITHLVQPRKETRSPRESLASSKESGVELGAKINLLLNEGISDNVEIVFLDKQLQ